MNQCDQITHDICNFDYKVYGYNSYDHCVLTERPYCVEPEGSVYIPPATSSQTAAKDQNKIILLAAVIIGAALILKK